MLDCLETTNTQTIIIMCMIMSLCLKRAAPCLSCTLQGGLPEGVDLTLMEQERADNIQRNKEALQHIMKGSTPAAAAAPPPGAAAAAAATAAFPSKPAGTAAEGGTLPPRTPGPVAPGKAAAVRSGLAAMTNPVAAAGGRVAVPKGSSQGRKPRGRTVRSPAAVAAASTAVPTSRQPKQHIPLQPVSSSAVLAGATAKAAAVIPSSSSKGLKRQAAAIAEDKIKDQMLAGQSVRAGAAKKRRRTVGNMSDGDVNAEDVQQGVVVGDDRLAPDGAGYSSEVQVGGKAVEAVMA